MIREIKLPAISENVESGEIISVLVSEGDYIEEQQDVVELETEKAAFEVPSEAAGTVAEIKVKKGQSVNVGDVLITVDTEGVPRDSAETKTEEQAKGGDGKPGEEEQEKQDRNQDVQEKSPPASATEEEEENKEREDKPGTGGGKESGRVNKQSGGSPALAAPSVRHLARELGVDIEQIPGNGPSGRILPEDVKDYVRRQMSSDRQTAAYTTFPAASTGRKLPDFTQFGEIEYEEFSKTRETIAETMTYAASTIPMVTQFERADVTEMERFRRQYQARAEALNTRLSITALMVKIAAAALVQFPRFNASVDEENHRIIYKKYVNISVAVETERGLLVPVVKQADKKGVLRIAEEIQQLSEQARTKKISPDDLRGGCFSISNLGGIGGGYFAPIVYWPDVAILGINRAIYEPVYVDDQLQRRLMMPLSLSYDHRLLDGADGARFLQWIKEALESPMSMLL